MTPTTRTPPANSAQPDPTTSPSADPSIAALSINAIRTLSIDAIQRANSGHPGLPLGAAPMAYVLWQRHLSHNPTDPRWPNRDRFILSGGHGSMLQYALLHLTGYALSLDDLKNFRQHGSPTPGHPEYGVTPGVEATTGPLGQGSANAVGMAMAERAAAHRFNRPGHPVVDHFTYALVTDGDLMEGISAEAASLAGHLGLGKLIYLYDANDISLDGPTSIAYTENFAKRYEAYGWQVLQVDDGDRDIDALDRAISAAKADGERPSLIIVRTTIGFGSPNKQGTAAAHGAPLGADEVARTKESLGWDPKEHFFVPPPVAQHMAAGERGSAAQTAWQQRFEAYQEAHPELAAEFQDALRGKLPVGWDSNLPQWDAGERIATRSASGKLINALAARVPWLIGGDADLSCSTKTLITDGGSFDGRTGAGRNIHFGVREHAMGAIANGMAYYGGLHPFVATFFVFSDYMRPAVRLAGLNGLAVTYVWTHDSICVGEDGPTHQPVEHLASLRALPNLLTVRPCDANETREAWCLALRHRDGPVALVLSRQDLPCFDRTACAPAAGLQRGAYVLSDAEGSNPAVILIATGSEVAVAMEARAELMAEGIATRVVSMPCWELFEQQDEDYRNSVLPPAVKARVAIEAGVTFGWHRWVGDGGSVVGIDRYGASAPAEHLMRAYDLTATRIVAAARSALKS